MTQKSRYPLKSILEKLQLKSLIHFENNNEVIGRIGDETLVDALVSSNLLAVLQAEMAMPIRLANDEIYEIILQNNRGIVAKEGRTNRYIVTLKMDVNNVLAAIGDDLDPGMVLFELMQFHPNE